MCLNLLIVDASHQLRKEVKPVAKKLTEMEEKFLDALMSEKCKGDFTKAKHMAGYSKNTSVWELKKRLRKEILERAEYHLATATVQAAWGLTDASTNARDPDIRERMMAMKEILDRGGVVKKEDKSGNEAPTTNVFVLPPKAQKA